MAPDANFMYGLNNDLKDRDSNQWETFSGQTLAVGDHVILSQHVGGKDRCKPGIITVVPQGRRSNYKVAVSGQNAGCPPRLFAFCRRGDGSVPDSAVDRIPHLSKGAWVKGKPDSLQYGQAIKIRSRRKKLNGSTGIFSRMKTTRASIQFGDDMWAFHVAAITEHQEMN